MLDMSWGEVLVIGAVALIVIGPKDLPTALRTLGNMVAKVRRMAGEFQSQFNEAMREAELDQVRKDVEGLNTSVSSLNTTFNPLQTIRDEVKGAIEAPATSANAGRAAPEPASPLDLPLPQSVSDEPARDLALPEAIVEPPPRDLAPADAPKADGVKA